MAHHGSDDTLGCRERARSILVSLILDTILIIPDVVAAAMANSVILFADVLKTVNELIATFLAWLTMLRVSRGKTVEYNYGYGKLESLTSMVVAGVMGISMAVAFYSAVERLKKPEEMHLAWAMLGMVMMALGVIVNGYLWLKNYRIAKKERSPVMESQWRLFRVKTFSDGSVLSSLVLSLCLGGYSWSRYIDPASSFVIIGFLAFSAYGVISNSVYDLMDKSIEESLQLIIVRELAKHFDDYAELHGVRSRRSGGDVYIEIFLEFEGSKTMAEVQRTINELKAAIEGKIKGSHVVISPTTEPMAV